MSGRRLRLRARWRSRAFGAHWAGKDVADLLKTGGQYQLIHAVAALVALRMDARGPAALFVIGSALFAGSLYALALGAPHPSARSRRSAASR